MSIRVMHAVWEHSRQKGAARLVLLAIADNANEDGMAYPSIKTLARKAGVSERTVQYVLTRLAASGELCIQPGGGRGHANRYVVHVGPHPERAQDVHPLPLKGAIAAPITGESTQALHPLEPERVQSTTGKGAIAIAPERSIEPSLLLPTAVADAIDGALAPLAGRGYVKDERFLAALGRTYPLLDLELEAMKLAEWLQEPRNQRRVCSKKFIDNWLKKAEADRVAREQAPARPGTPGTNGRVDPPAAFQRNPNPDAAIPAMSAEAYERSRRAAELAKARVHGRAR